MVLDSFEFVDSKQDSGSDSSRSSQISSPQPEKRSDPAPSASPEKNDLDDDDVPF